MTARRPTIVDVARAAGVSKSTVSLVLQESPLVKPATRAAVRRAMAETGYVYNRGAAGLRRAGAGLVALVINDLRNPFFTEFAASAQAAFLTRGYATVLANTDEDPGLQDRIVASMIEHGAAALVISPAYGGGEAFDALARAGVPAMQVLRRADPRGALFPFASLDYAHGGWLAARHLVERGARRIAFVGGVAGRPITAERLSGYLAAMAGAGQPPLVLHGRASRGFGREAAAVLTRDHSTCDAAVCFNDLVALGMLAGFAEMGRAVGRDFRLTGFDDIEEAALAFPPLSSVRCDIASFGRGVADTMLAWLERGERPAPETRAPVTLVARASS